MCPSGGLEEGREQFETVQMTPRPRHSLSENLPIQAKMGWSHFPVNTCDMNEIKARHACTEKKLSTRVLAWIVCEGRVLQTNYLQFLGGVILCRDKLID